jgi:tetratricopeptide (TPR) repeat protein
MCGGNLEAQGRATTVTCTYCGTQQTLPRAADEQKANLHNRANHLRRSNDFDRAVAAYENLLNLDDGDAEAHWGLLLSRYGIEYVEDPATHERIPTCHRVQGTSILTDPDYGMALQHAPDGYSRQLYEREAARIAEIQKGILAISANESPYDVFICYKETSDSGARTKDSALAQDVYYSLTKEGYKVFFSRITLERVLGQQYEPYIFAALNSAKVMLAIGTAPEHFNAVWVKNEWSRYLALMKKDRSKLLIPCYLGMDPYDLPEELSMLQSQDMGKIGFIQDLLHGVGKVVRPAKAQPSGVAGAAAGVAGAATAAVAPGVESLYKRMALFLEDGDFDRADEYCDRILDIDPEYAPAYMGKLCVELEMESETDLLSWDQPIDDSSNFSKALRFADTQTREVYNGYALAIQKNIKESREEAERRAQKEWEEAKRKKEERAKAAQKEREEAQRKKEERAKLLAAEAILEGKLETAKTRIQEIDAEVKMLTAAINDLQTRRETLGFWGLFVKRTEQKELDAQIASNERQRNVLIGEKETLIGEKETSKNIAACKWKCLAVDEQNKRALFITENLIAKMPYHPRFKNVVWADCALRKWLNTDFYNQMPSDVKNLIVATKLINGKNPNYGTNGGPDTTDRIFLLSIDEANKYFKSDGERIANYGGGGAWWWLRSPGDLSNNAAGVDGGGSVDVYGSRVSNARGGVRPALWLNLES